MAGWEPAVAGLAGVSNLLCCCGSMAHTAAQPGSPGHESLGGWFPLNHEVGFSQASLTSCPLTVMSAGQTGSEPVNLLESIPDSSGINQDKNISES